MSKFIYAFPATGKTQVAMKYKNIIELSSENYHWLDIKNGTSEGNKGQFKMVNPKWPNNFYNKIKELDKQDELLVLITHSASVICQNLCIPYMIIYPHIDCKNEYIERMKKRGNKDNVVKNMKNNFENYVANCMSDNYAQKHIVLNRGEYLEDALLREKLIGEFNEIRNK